MGGFLCHPFLILDIRSSTKKHNDHQLYSPSPRAMMTLEVRDENYFKSLLWHPSYKARVVVGLAGSCVHSDVHRQRSRSIVCNG